MQEMVSPAGIFQSSLRAEIYVSVLVALPVTVTGTWQKPFTGRDLWFMVLGVQSLMAGKAWQRGFMSVGVWSSSSHSGQARK